VSGRFPVKFTLRIAALANPELGAKQICPACQSKFYDLNRRPATCPKCGEQFDPEEAIKNRRVRARAVTPDYESDDEAETKAPKEVEGYEDEADETPEIDAAADEAPPESGDDDNAEPGGGDDIGVDFAEDDEDAEGDDVPFLEEEDEDFDGDDIEVPGEDDEDR
jgi:uncharacterized protein (TIGR02300 family)